MFLGTRLTQFLASYTEIKMATAPGKSWNNLVESCMLAHSQYVKAMKDFKKVKVNNEKS